MIRVYTDLRCLEHPAPAGFPERPERLAGVLAGLTGVDGIDVVAAPPVDGLDEALAAVHDPDYLARFARAVERGDGLLDSADNPLGAGTLGAARAAAAATLAALEHVLAGRGNRAFAAVRPPGHHAERDRAMGFCYLNSVAIAAERARRRHGLERVAIVDFDVHHGNGSQHLFEERPDVFYASLHQWPFYPGTGAANERGRGAGAGATLNLPLPAGSGDADYARAFAERLLPELDRFAPDLLLVSAGFDAWQGDPLGGMRVTAGGFAEWGDRLRTFAERRCDGRVLSVLEGGYDLAALPELVRGYLRNML